MADRHRAFMFFNCDENRSDASMNVSYNNAVYRDTRDSRRDLWYKVRDEIDNGNVVIDEFDRTYIRDVILHTDPLYANDKIKYGNIVCLEIY